MKVRLTLSEIEVREYQATSWDSTDGVITIRTTEGAIQFSEEHVIAVEEVRELGDAV